MLVEDGVEEFSNAAGVIHISFQKGHISGSIGEILAAMKREKLF
jgi:hypothetical protein